MKQRKHRLTCSSDTWALVEAWASVSPSVECGVSIGQSPRSLLALGVHNSVITCFGKLPIINTTAQNAN